MYATEFFMSFCMILLRDTYVRYTSGNPVPVCSCGMSVTHHDSSIIFNLISIVNIAHIHGMGLAVVSQCQKREQVRQTWSAPAEFPALSGSEAH